MCDNYNSYLTKIIFLDIKIGRLMGDHKKRFSRNQSWGNIQKDQFFKNLLNLGCFMPVIFRVNQLLRHHEWL